MSDVQVAPPLEAARACVVLTGDELLRGFVQDANSGHVARGLRRLGIDLVSIRFVADGLASITEALMQAAEQVGAGGVVVVSGGLGPTHDDRTSEAVAAVTGHPLELDEQALEVVDARVRALGRMQTAEEEALFAAGNRKQATLPRRARALDPAGTAPGYILESSNDGVAWVVLPGPPPELRHAWAQAAASAELGSRAAAAPARLERIIRIYGHPEAHVAHELLRLGHVDGPGVQVTLCARDGELELSIRGHDAVGVDRLTNQLRDVFGSAVFASDDERPVAQIVGGMLEQSGLRIATAESCTGGMLGTMLSGMAGASRWFVGSVVAYDNDVKAAVVGVDRDDIATHGAVSEQVARQLAEGARAVLGADVGVGITGIAGPGGGSEDKPVGTVFVGVAAPSGTTVRRLRLPGDRDAIRRRASIASLHLVRQALA